VPEPGPAEGGGETGVQAGPPADEPRADGEGEARGDATADAEVVMVEVREVGRGGPADVAPEPAAPDAAPVEGWGEPDASAAGEESGDAVPAVSGETQERAAEVLAQDTPRVDAASTADGGTPDSALPGVAVPPSGVHGVSAGPPAGGAAPSDVDRVAAEADEAVVERGAPVRGRGGRRRRAARRRAAPRPAIEELDPIQAHARKGVCVVYFVNHECWRVPDAYCNTALQVCVMRDCPVYHLHQEALERRFAGKYKHLW